MLKSKGPILFASNHPNSFLDGMILTTLLKEPLYSLARGDAFKNKWINKLLRRLKLLPVYRTSEGVENLEHNYITFAWCQQTFEQNGMVLIFSEGRCENEWHLRPLKKGTARLAIAAWQQNIALKVIPTAFNYSSFKKFGKEIHLFFGEPITSSSVTGKSEGKKILAFNRQLQQQLQQLVYEIDPEDKEIIQKKFFIKKLPSFYLLLLPAIVGWILHAPLYYLCRFFTGRYFKDSGHYDSVLNSLLLLFYPFYLLILFFAGYSLQPLFGLLLFALAPFTAWAAVQAKYQAGF